MKRIRGIRLRHRVTTLFRYVFRRNRTRPRTFSGYQRLDPSTCKTKRISRLFSCLKKKAKSLCFSNPSGVPGRAYSLLEEDKAVEVVPKGQMAVYVGQKDGGDFHRVLVPVMYFNHPLFGRLLREAEEEYGFDHPGGITIPCRISEFESVQTRIAAGRGCRKLMTRKMGF
ncbi:hypothetical protein ACSBR2_016901 [Camellia fascicularis]